jgi:hypothetical protein
MKTQHQQLKALMTVLIFAAVCGCRTGPVCILYETPHLFSASEVAGSWIGFEAIDTDIYRLYLNTNGTGMLATAYTSDERIETIRSEVLRWTISTNNQLFCLFRQPDVYVDNFDMTCKVRGESMEALLRNGEQGATGAKVKITFLRENDLDEKLRALCH